MKLINVTILTLSFLILSNAQSTEENPPSEDSSPSDGTSEEPQPEEPTESSDESSSPSGEEEGLSSEPAEDDSAPKADGDEQDAEQDKDDSKPDKPEKSGKTKSAKKKGKEQGSDTDATSKGSYSATYSEIGKILDAVDFKSIEDLHLQRMLENTFQARLRNPIRDQTGQIANFAAIKSCFGKVGTDVKKLINDAKKEFKTCKTGGGNSSGCTDEQENKFADGVINVATTLQGCISSKRKD